jgi:hypothetical protein
MKNQTLFCFFSKSGEIVEIFKKDLDFSTISMYYIPIKSTVFIEIIES